MPSIFIHSEYKPEIIKNFVKRQKRILQAIQQEMEEKKMSKMTPHEYVKSGMCSFDPRAFLILDDCLYDKSWVNDKNIRLLFMNGRHYFAMVIITMQYALGIPPNLRTNIDYVFILRENIYCNRKRIYEQYAGMFPSFEVFCQVMDQCTENFECLVVNNNAKSNKIDDQIFWYKADSHEDFQLGHPSLWKYHVENYNHNADDSDEDFDPSSTRKKKGTLINVKKSY
jgi:hypothetical protein